MPLYLAAERPVLERDGMLMMIDDNRIDLQPGEVIKKRMVRFRTLGCWPLTGAGEPNAQTPPEIIEEMLVSTTSERQGCVIDRRPVGFHERKTSGIFKMNTALAITNSPMKAASKPDDCATNIKSLLRFLTCVVASMTAK